MPHAASSGKNGHSCSIGLTGISSVIRLHEQPCERRPAPARRYGRLTRRERSIYVSLCRDVRLPVVGLCAVVPDARRRTCFWPRIPSFRVIPSPRSLRAGRWDASAGRLALCASPNSSIITHLSGVTQRRVQRNHQECLRTVADAQRGRRVAQRSRRVAHHRNWATRLRLSPSPSPPSLPWPLCLGPLPSLPDIR